MINSQLNGQSSSTGVARTILQGAVARNTRHVHR